MGQHFMLLNLDKNQKVEIGKFGEGYSDTNLSAYLCSQHSWAGDRLILLGDEAKDIPAGVEEDSDPEYGCTYHGPNHSTKPRCGRIYGYGKGKVLRNICTREYIREDLFPSEDEHPGFGEVLLTMIVWTSDSAMHIPSGHVDPRGKWAGGRFDVVALEDVKDDPSWKDITESQFFRYYDFWSADMGAPEKCGCELCGKYIKEELEYFKGVKPEGEPIIPIEICKPIIQQASFPFVPPIVQFGISSGPTRLSAIELLPVETTGEILSYLNTSDLAAIVIASKALSPQATEILYSSVKLNHVDQTETLLQTITRRPELAGYIKEIRIVIKPHWESLQIAHEILKQLPALHCLEFDRCWFSYGSLPYWEYPFTLRSLTWGLQKDAACERFCHAHPSAEVAWLDPAHAISRRAEDYNWDEDNENESS